MTDDELEALITAMRRARTEAAGIEVKRAKDQLPSNIVETLSAFANSPGGGVIVLGLDERSGFSTVGVADPKTMVSKIAGLCADVMEPRLQPLIQTHDFEDTVVVTVEVPELDPGAKPCFYKGAGRINGSFRRVGDADLRMSAFEVRRGSATQAAGARSSHSRQSPRAFAWRTACTGAAPARLPSTAEHHVCPLPDERRRRWKDSIR